MKDFLFGFAAGFITFPILVGIVYILWALSWGTLFIKRRK